MTGKEGVTAFLNLLIINAREDNNLDVAFI